jgi:hypothetical protein
MSGNLDEATSTSTSTTPTLTISAPKLFLGLARLSPTAYHTALSLPLSTHLDAIQQNWEIREAFNAFLGLQRCIRPEREIPDWEEVLVPAVALLSEALKGQCEGALGLVLEVR